LPVPLDASKNNCHVMTVRICTVLSAGLLSVKKNEKRTAAFELLVKSDSRLVLLTVPAVELKMSLPHGGFSTPEN